MSLTSHLTKLLLDLLEERRIVVWYDREAAFKDHAAAFRAPACRVVMATDSTLRARREAESVYAKMNESADHAEARANLLLYLPRPRGATPEARQRDPFEVFALARHRLWGQRGGAPAVSRTAGDARTCYGDRPPVRRGSADACAPGRPRIGTPLAAHQGGA